MANVNALRQRAINFNRRRGIFPRVLFQNVTASITLANNSTVTVSAIAGTAGQKIPCRTTRLSGINSFDSAQNSFNVTPGATNSLDNENNNTAPVFRVEGLKYMSSALRTWTPFVLHFPTGISILMKVAFYLPPIGNTIRFNAAYFTQDTNPFQVQRIEPVFVHPVTLAPTATPRLYVA